MTSLTIPEYIFHFTEKKNTKLTESSIYMVIY